MILRISCRIIPSVHRLPRRKIHLSACYVVSGASVHVVMKPAGTSRNDLGARAAGPRWMVGEGNASAGASAPQPPLPARGVESALAIR